MKNPMLKSLRRKALKELPNAYRKITKKVKNKKNKKDIRFRFNTLANMASQQSISKSN